MAYDDGLAARVRELMPPDTDEVRMFGGLAFMVNTHLAVSVSATGLLIRADGADGAAGAIARGAEPMVMGARTMKGYVRVPAPLVATAEDLAAWVAPAVEQALARPPKDEASSGRRRGAEHDGDGATPP